MRRRDLLAGAAGAGLLGIGGAAYALTSGSGPDVSATVETIDAQGSTAGELTVPVRDEVTLLDLFATWCVPCQAQMDALTTLHDEYGDRVRFVSVTNERVGATLTRQDIRDWWTRYDGDWTVGLDPDGTLLRELSAEGIPYLVVADRNGRVTFTHAGVTTADRLRTELDAVL